MASSSRISSTIFITAERVNFSIFGVALGVMALIVVTGVMTGFGNNLREKIIGSAPHVLVEREGGIKDYPDVARQLQDLEGVAGVSPYVQGNVFLEVEGRAVGLVVRGVDPQTEERVTRVKEYLTQGNLQELKDDGVIIGQELARYFGFAPGDTVTIIAPGSGISGQGWRYELTVAGVFNTGMIDYDMSLAFVSLPKAQEIFQFPQERVTGLGMSLQDPEAAGDVQKRIYAKMGYSYNVKTWIDLNRNLFDALFLEKWGLFIILTLMVLVASFNIISTLIVTVTSKIHDIGILKSIGASKASIRNIFTAMGVYIGSSGTFLGFVGGIGVSYILKTYVKVPAEIYSIDRVPLELQLLDLLLIAGAAILISYLASIYPASRAANLQPVEALRYE